MFISCFNPAQNSPAKLLFCHRHSPDIHRYYRNKGRLDESEELGSILTSGFFTLPCQIFVEIDHEIFSTVISP